MANGTYRIHFTELLVILSVILTERFKYVLYFSSPKLVCTLQVKEFIEQDQIPDGLRYIETQRKFHPEDRKLIQLGLILRKQVQGFIENVFILMQFLRPCCS